MASKMPPLSLAFAAQQDDESDADEAMVEVLKKLKKAESSQTADKKRKHNQAVLQKVITEFEAECREEADRVKRKCKKAATTAVKQAEDARSVMMSLKQRLGQCSEQRRKEVVTLRQSTEAVLRKLDALSEECSTLQQAPGALPKDIQQTKDDVRSKLKELEQVLTQIASSSGKQDRFATLVKSLIVR